MKLFIFGSCSGTEPITDRHHTAFAIEINKRIYWFDAGENCSYTAHLMGVDLLRVSDIFISHSHMDHVGGLGNLLWNIRKLSNLNKKLPEYGDINVYMPNQETFDGIMTVLKNTEGNYSCDYKTVLKNINDSVILKNEDIEVTACHNFHLSKINNMWQSFSFVVKAENKKIVYSADVKEFEDLSGMLEYGCDVLLMETGHHKPEEVCQKIKDSNFSVKELYFLHHGRAILNDYNGSLERCKEIYPFVKFLNDKDVFEF